MPRPKHHFKTKAGKPSRIIKDKYVEIEQHSRKPDLDNLIKMLADTVQGKHRMILDDSQICRIQAEKVYSKQPRTEIIIEEF